MRKIFLCYRREDTGGYAGRLYDRLAAHFGAEHIFMDVDAIEPGEDFAKVIQAKVASSDVLLILIGKTWLTAQADNGRRRLDDPSDFVRLEIATGLARGVPLLPILVAGAAMPRLSDLPGDLSQVALRQAVEIRDAGFHRQVTEMLPVHCCPANLLALAGKTF
jgi:TIR domain